MMVVLSPTVSMRGSRRFHQIIKTGSDRRKGTSLHRAGVYWY